MTPLGEVTLAFTKLGLTSFGGPVAHLGFLRDEFVRRRAWLDEAAYADLVALCQFLPGPASSQVVFALGLTRAGIAGALLASLAFMGPSLALMIGFAHGLASLEGAGSGWLHGLKLAAVCVVADAVLGMGRRLCPDLARVLVALAAAALVLWLAHALAQVAVIVLGSLIGWLVYRRSAALADAPAELAPLRGALAALGVFTLLLAVLPWLAWRTGSFELAQADAFYRAGSLVFGGGHVVLPLLHAELVPRGWLSNDEFLAGYGAAQAVPGPLFTFAAYLGAVINRGQHAWLGGLGCAFAIFLPAFLLVYGALPFWQRLKTRAWARAALNGANAAVVGVLLAALVSPVFPAGVRNWADLVVAALGLGALLTRRVPPWAVVGACMALGQWVLV